MQLTEKLKILTEGAKYDVSCASSMSHKTKNHGNKGTIAPSGICHSFTADGRCVSLFKILLSNDCCYDCKYCPNKYSANVKRTSLSPDEICNLTMQFYKRNYIEGLFLSSAILKNPEYTMNLLLQTVKKLRTEYDFGGYIHLKGIVGANTKTINEAAKYTDRMSFNMEFTTQENLKELAPQKNLINTVDNIKNLNYTSLEYKKSKTVKNILPAGQSTQLIIGANKTCDSNILKLSENMYKKGGLKRVYYSAYMPVVKDALLPQKAESLVRENRLYQADWLLRFYGFSSNEILNKNSNLNLDLDPKTNYALNNINNFPLEVNKASYQELLRVPGIGLKGAYKIVNARKYCKLTFYDLKKMRIVLKKAKHFILCDGKFYGYDKDLPTLKELLKNETFKDGFKQTSLFDNINNTKKELLLL